MRIRKWHIFAGFSLVILVLAGDQLKGEFEKRAELARLQSMGVPTDRTGLRQSRRTDPDATAKYSEIYSLLEHTSKHGYTAFIRQGRIEPYHIKLLSTNSEALKDLKEVTLLGAPAEYPAIKHQDYELLAALPQVSAYVSSLEGDHQEALRWLKTLDTLMMQFRDMPGFARKNAREWNYPPVEQVLLRSVRDDKAALQELNSYLQSRPALPPPASELRLNFLEMDELITIWSQGDKLSSAWRYSGPSGKRMRKSIRQTSLAVMSEIQQDEIDFSSQEGSILSALKTASTNEARMLCNGMITTLHTAYRAETLRRLELIAAKILMQRLETGSAPRTFACPPELPDPFTKKPLLYRKLNDGFVVYSPGANGVYDKGLADDISISIQW